LEGQFVWNSSLRFPSLISSRQSVFPPSKLQAHNASSIETLTQP